MGIFSFLKKALPTPTKPQNTSLVGDRGQWWIPLVREPFTGAWQKNMELRPDTALVYSTVYSVITLIASDVGKIRLRLVELIDQVWKEVRSNSFTPVLRKPNRYQTRIKFIEMWVTSKLIHGNTYVLKERDQRGVVISMHVLDPLRTSPLVASDGSVYYQLSADNLVGIDKQIIVPASEIIHDTAVCLYHPLCGVSPLTACALAALQGLSIQQNSQKFFSNGSQPGGILTAPHNIPAETAARIKEYWEKNYTGANVGKVAVLGDGLKYEAMSVNAVDAQLIEQLKWSSETICSVFHVPPYMVGIGPMPAYNNIQALNQQYYTQCLQTILENIELLLDEGLGLLEVRDHTYGTEFDLDSLLRMDTLTKSTSWKELVAGGIAAPNEARRQFDLPPVEGGDSPFLQQQNYSLAALAKRDAKEDPFSTSSSTPAPEEEPEEEVDEEEAPDEETDVEDEDDLEEDQFTEVETLQLVLESRSLMMKAGLPL